MHPSLRFTLEKESNSTLPFLDVLLYKEESCFLNRVYRKPPFACLYIRWSSFCPKKRKLNLVKTLADRSLMICTKPKLDCEGGFITDTLCNYGFPEDVVRSVIRDKIAHFHKTKVASAQRCPVYLRVKQHVPTKIRLRNYVADYINNTYGSTIAEYLINNRECASTYSASLLTIFSRSHSDVHPKALEAIYIFTHKPSLCKQRECLLGLDGITI